MLMDIVSFVSGLVLMLFGICIVLWILYDYLKCQALAVFNIL